MVYPQYQVLIPRDGESGEGGGFWQSIVNYFGSCGGEGDSLSRRIIPPTIDTRYPDREAEKVGETDKKDKIEQIDQIPSKPYYFVLPPTLGPHSYYPQSNFLQPNFLAKHQNNPFSTFLNTKSQVIPQNDNINSMANIDIRSNGFDVKTNSKQLI